LQEKVKVKKNVRV